MLKAVLFAGACIFAPEMVMIGLAATAVAKAAAEDYVHEAKETDAFLKKECDGDPGYSTMKAACVTANAAVGLAPFTCGATALMLGRETRKLREMRQMAANGRGPQSLEPLPF
jgi:hypothetical protein